VPYPAPLVPPSSISAAPQAIPHGPHPPWTAATYMGKLTANDSAVIISPVRPRRRHKKQPSAYSQSDLEVWRLSDAEIIGDLVIMYAPFPPP
jgi:hypothetical protein